MREPGLKNAGTADLKGPGTSAVVLTVAAVGSSGTEPEGSVSLSARKLQDELLNLELFLSLEEAKYVAERSRLGHNHRQPHSSLNWMATALRVEPERSCP